MEKKEYQKPELIEVDYNGLVSGGSCQDHVYGEGSGVHCDPVNDTSLN